MRLAELLTESLHDVITLLKSDARQLEDLNQIELNDDWEIELPRLAHRYEKEVQRVYNSFDDPEHRDEHDWDVAHMKTTQDFLITHNLAKKLD